MFFNNTFVGTLAAGLVLVWVSIRQYRKQKETDIEYDFIRRKREFAADLFSKVDLAMKHYDAQVAIYGGKNPQIQNLVQQMNQKHNDYFAQESEKSFNAFVSEITRSADNLISTLKLDKKYSEEKIAITNTNIAMFNVMFQLGVFFRKTTSGNVEEQQEEIKKVAKSITDALQEIIGTK